MEDVGTEYEVALKIMYPKFDTERRFVTNELAYVKRRAAGLENTWRPVAVPVLGVYRKQDWQHYAHELEHYGRELDKHAREIDEEWLPFQIFVANVGRHNDSAINVKMLVEHGTISEKKTAPKRPDRLDGMERVDLTPFAKYSGFVRSGVKVGRHELAAVFSRLEAGKSAELTRQTLYLHYNDQTRLRFEIDSRRVHGLTGDVVV